MRTQPIMQLAIQEQLRVDAICTKWQNRTQAMAVGITDHVWTFRELLTAKFDRLDCQK